MQGFWRVFLICILVLAACAPEESNRGAALPPSVGDSIGIEAVYRAMQQAYARLDVDALSAVFTTSGVFAADSLGFRPSRPFLQEGFAPLFDAARAESAHFDLQFRFVRRFRAPGLAADAGYYSFRKVGGTTTFPEMHGWFVSILVPDSTGTWQFAVDTDALLTKAAFEAAPPYHP